MRGTWLRNLIVQKNRNFAFITIIISCIIINAAYWNIVTIQQPQYNTDHFVSVNKSFTLDSQLDVIKYTLTNTTICDVWETSSILVGTHHKTGSRLLGALSLQILQRYFQPICFHKNTIPLKYSLYGKNKRKRLNVNWGLSQYTVERFHNYSLKKLNETRNNGYSYHFVTLNIVRDPVDTVLSEYNFDKKGYEELSTWTINELLHHDKLKQTVIDIYIPIIEPILNMTRDEIINRYSLQVLWTKHLSIEYGLIGAWLLYKYIFHPHILSSYQSVNYYGNIEKHNNYLHYANFKLDSDFGVNFTQTCEIYLDKLGIINSYHRSELLNRFQKHDISKRKVTIHATNGSYNKTLQYELLLKSPMRCRELKDMTAKLDYKWRFPGKC
eukprot:232069_1